MARIFIGAIAILFSLFSCTFQPSGDILTEIEIPEPTETVTDFFQLQDTLLVRGFFYSSLSVSSAEEIREYRIFVDDEVITTEMGSPTSINFNSKDFDDGIHTVTLEVTKVRESESLASQLELEVYTQTYSRKIDIYNKPVVASGLSATIENGVLVVSWDAYTGPRFESYRITCLAPYAYEFITTAGNTSVAFPDFVGGISSFYLTVSAFGEEATNSMSYQALYDAKIERTPDGLKYQWLESPFVNCAGFRIKLEAGGQSQQVDFLNETKVVDLPASFSFPYNVTGTIEALANDGDNVLLTTQNHNTFEKIGGTNPDYHRYKQFIKHPSNESLLLIYYLDDAAETYESRGRLVLYNRVTGEEIKMKTGFFGISPSGQHIYHYNDFGYIVELDPTDLSEKSGGFRFRDIVPTGTFWQFHVSDDNKLLLYATQVTPGVNKYFVYDWEARQLLFTTNMTFGNGIHRTGALGNGGRYFYNLDTRKVLMIDTQPTQDFTLGSNTRERPLVHRNNSISPTPGNLVINGLPPPDPLYQISYPNTVARIFSNQQNEFGVVYVQAGKVKIDFFDQRNLTFLTTLETQLLPGYASNYVFSLVGDELFVYLYHNYDQGPVHSVKINF